MKLALTALDVYFLVHHELQKLVDLRLDKLYQDGESFLFTGYGTKQGKQFLRIQFPSLMYLTVYKESFPTTPPGYCVFLRKYLGNAIITSVEQYEFQRVVVLKLTKKERSFTLIIELFDEGNMILCDETGKIMSPFKNQQWSDRTVRGGREYVYPQTAFTVFDLTGEEFFHTYTSANKSISGFLAKECGFGKYYAAELCAEASVDAQETLKEKESIGNVFHAVQKIRKKEYDPHYSDGKFFAFPLKGVEGQSFETLSAILDELHGKQLPVQQQAEQVKAKKEQQSKFEKITTSQTKMLENLEQGILINQKKGELLYEHYEALQSLLTNIETLRKKHSWKEVKEQMKEHPLVKDIDEKTGKLTVTLKE